MGQKCWLIICKILVAPVYTISHIAGRWAVGFPANGGGGNPKVVY